MIKSFVSGVLSTRRRRQNFFYLRFMGSIACAWAAFHFGGAVINATDWIYALWAVTVIAFVAGYMTIAPIAAFLICLVDWLLSMGL